MLKVFVFLKSQPSSGVILISKSCCVVGNIYSALVWFIKQDSFISVMTFFRAGYASPNRASNKHFPKLQSKDTSLSRSAFLYWLKPFKGDIFILFLRE